MKIRREQAVRSRLEQLLEELAQSPARPPQAAAAGGLSRGDALACVEAAFQNRLLDLAARQLKDAGEGYYTISSAGHEANAVLGRLLRPTDPCLVHYRSGALVAARMRPMPGATFLYDVLLSFVASSDDPVSGGRHKVWGSRRLWMPPQTSTIASHLPKAVGMAFSLARASHLGIHDGVADDAIVMASFGDASVNHASAQTAFNAACWASHQHLPLPILFVCEDNGLGISVHTPKDWIWRSFGHRRGLEYFDADGRDLRATWEVARKAIETCRQTRRPCFLRLEVVRLLGHAGSDIESTYHDERWIEANETRDPLLRWCRLVCDLGFCTAKELRDLYESIRAQIDRAAKRAVARPKLASAAEVQRELAYPAWESVAAAATRAPDPAARLRCWIAESKLPENDRPRHMAMQISRALTDLMVLYPEMLVFGEDIAKKGGVYHVTAGLYERFGAGRVFNTLLDETMVLGLAIGAAQIGLLPVPEIQYLAYLHNAEDQLRGEACSQRFFSNGQWDNPMVVRIASFAYQKGFGGHFHNDNSLAVLRDVPGLVIATPSRADDAAAMLRTCMALARSARCVCVFLEPIALYMRRDLHEPGDGRWAFPYPPAECAVPFGQARHYEPAREGGPRVLVVTYGNGVPMALSASIGHPASVHVMDLRWLAPLPVADFLEHAARSDAVLVVDECRRTGGGVAEALLAALAEDDRTRGALVLRLTAHDTYVPLGAAANHVLPQEEDIRRSLDALVARLEGT